VVYWSAVVLAPIPTPCSLLAPSTTCLPPLSTPHSPLSTPHSHMLSGCCAPPPPLLSSSFRCNYQLPATSYYQRVQNQQARSARVHYFVNILDSQVEAACDWQDLVCGRNLGVVQKHQISAAKNKQKKYPGTAVCWLKKKNEAANRFASKKKSDYKTPSTKKPIPFCITKKRARCRRTRRRCRFFYSAWPGPARGRPVAFGGGRAALLGLL
jgi:hypothetical protein